METMERNPVFCIINVHQHIKVYCSLCLCGVCLCGGDGIWICV